jgi:hypothetical protein
VKREPAAVASRPRTLADLYENRDLTAAQARRIVALLGLAARQAEANPAEEEAA